MIHKTFTFSDGYSLEIHQDDSHDTPRNWDNLGTMVCFHSRYDLGDKHDIDHTEFGGWDEMQKWIEHENPGCVILPLYLYDHSGITMRVGSFQGRVPQGHAEFDSGQVGFIFVSRETIKKEFGEHGGRTDDQIREQLTGEVETYDQFLRGDVWGYIWRYPPCGMCGGQGEVKEDDSCWGFYGDDPLENGMLDHFDEKYSDELREEKCTVTA